MDEKQEAAAREQAERETRADLGQGAGGPETNGHAPLEASEIRQRVKDADDVRFRDELVEEWGVTIRVFSMSGRERARMLEEFLDDSTGELKVDQLYPQLLIATCYSPETGDHPSPEHRVFSSADEAWLNEKSSAPLERLGKAALAMSGMGREAKERVGKG